MPTKIYETKRHSTRFSYALKPNTKTQNSNLDFRPHAQLNTILNPCFPMFSEKPNTKLKSQINEQNPRLETTNSHITLNTTTHTTSSPKSKSLCQFISWVQRESHCWFWPWIYGFQPQVQRERESQVFGRERERESWVFGQVGARLCHIGTFSH